MSETPLAGATPAEDAFAGATFAGATSASLTSVAAVGAAAPASAATAAFDAWRERFLAAYFALKPVNATFIGVHDHDHALPDCAPVAVAAQLARLAGLREELAALPTAALDPARRHDAVIADAFLALHALEDTLPHFHRGNPAYSTGEGVFAILALFLRDAAPLEDRVAAAVSRMHALPAFLAQARANVTAAPVAWTEHALREARAGAAYFRHGLPRLAADRGIVDPRFLPAAERAAAAFTDHAAWLDATLRHHPSDDYACGRAAFDQYLHRGHCLAPAQDATWLAGHAARALAEAQAALTEKAAALDPTRPWSEQLAGLAEQHPPADGYYAAFAREWETARAAALAADLVTWPAFPIDYVPVPASDREAAAGLYYLPYRCPAPWGQPEVQRYLVPPLPPASEPAAQDRVLRTMNDAAITLNHVVHHGGLGHHVQNWYAFRGASRLGQIGGVDCASRIALFAAGTLVEGWACYATDLMDEVGYLTPLASLSQAQSRVRMAARAVADVGLHTGALTLAETAALYAREAGLPAAAAQTEAVKNSMFPGAAMIYLVGTEAIHTLRRQTAAQTGPAFSLRAFHDRLLSYGAIPTALIAREMLGAG